jgi:hypothetical protein
MKTWLTGIGCLVLIGSTIVSATQEEATSMESSLEEFHEFSQAIQGRWSSEIIWIND